MAARPDYLVAIYDIDPITDSYRAASIDWFAEEGRRICGDVLQTTNNNLRMVTIKEPVGVVAAVTPWNFPCR